MRLNDVDSGSSNFFEYPGFTADSRHGVTEAEEGMDIEESGHGGAHLGWAKAGSALLLLFAALLGGLLSIWVSGPDAATAGI